MELKLFKTLWGFDGDYGRAAAQAKTAGFDGLEGQVPEEPAAREALQAALDAHGLDGRQPGGRFVDRPEPVGDQHHPRVARQRLLREPVATDRKSVV